MKALKKWREDNGLNYKGWCKHWIIQLLRKYKLGWIIPFYFYQDDYDDGIQRLSVYRWGKYSGEVYQWINYNHDHYYAVSATYFLSRKQLYTFINIMSKRVK